MVGKSEAEQKQRGFFQGDRTGSGGPSIPLSPGAGSVSVGELREVAAGIPVLPPHEDDDGGGDKGEEDQDTSAGPLLSICPAPGPKLSTFPGYRHYLI